MILARGPQTMFIYNLWCALSLEYQAISVLGLRYLGLGTQADVEQCWNNRQVDDEQSWNTRQPLHLGLVLRLTTSFPGTPGYQGIWAQVPGLWYLG